MTGRRADGLTGSRTGGRAVGLTGCVLMFLVLLACASRSVRPSARLPVVFGPDSRVLITDFSDITALAASSWYVFAATPHGLLIYDRIARRFRTPVTVLEGYPRGRVLRAFPDPSGHAVWLDLGSASAYYRYDVDARGWTSGGIDSERADEGLSVAAALASAPAADAMRAMILADPRLRTHQFTAAAATPDRPEIFFGTNGLGLVWVDKQTGEWQVLSYGLMTPGVGAVAAATDGVWAATNARPGSSQRRGLTFVAHDLSTTRSSEGGGAALGFSFLNSRRLLSARNSLWLATEQGVVRIDPSTFRSQQFDLPDATSLAAAPDGIWVGTTRGLFKVASDDQITAYAPSVPVVSLLAVQDTLWVGTTSGLGRVTRGSDQITTLPELADRPSLRVTIHALACVQDTIVMATERELLWREPTTNRWNSLPLPAGLGIPTALTAAGAGGVWVGGWGGIAHVDLTRGAGHLHAVPLELPAAVRDLTISDDYLWVATDSGLVRIR